MIALFSLYGECTEGRFIYVIIFLSSVISVVKLRV